MNRIPTWINGQPWPPLGDALADADILLAAADVLVDSATHAKDVSELAPVAETFLTGAQQGRLTAADTARVHRAIGAAARRLEHKVLPAARMAGTSRAEGAMEFLAPVPLSQR